MLQLFYDSRQCASDHLSDLSFVYHRLISDETWARLDWGWGGAK